MKPIDICKMRVSESLYAGPPEDCQELAEEITPEELLVVACLDFIDEQSMDLGSSVIRN